MTTVSDYLVRLNELRSELAEDLTIQGVESSATETWQELVPKVLDIAVGGNPNPWFSAVFVDDPPHTVEDSVEYVSGFLSVTGFYKIASITLTCVEDEGTATFNADGWTASRENFTITLTRTFEDGATLRTARNAVAAVKIAALADEDADDYLDYMQLSVSCSATDTDGNAFEADNTTVIILHPTITWEQVEAEEYTWEMIEAEEFTWTTFEHSVS